MDNRDIRAAADRADWQVILGVTAGVGLVGWRLLSVFAFALGESPSYRLALAALVETILCAFLTWRVYAGSSVAAVALFAIWALGVGYAWYAAATVLPPFFLFSIAIGLGLAQGARGTLARRAHASVHDPAA